MRGLESRDLEVLEEREEEVYQARQPKTKIKVEREGAAPAFSHDSDRLWWLAVVVVVVVVVVVWVWRLDRLRANRRGRSKLRLGLLGCHDDAVASGSEELDDEVEKDEREETASNARDLTLESAAFIVVDRS